MEYHVAEKPDCNLHLKKIFFNICFFFFFFLPILQGIKVFCFSATSDLIYNALDQGHWQFGWVFSFLKKSNLRRLFSLYLIFFLQYFFSLLLLIPFFQYCFGMLRIQTLWKVKGVHILFLLTLSPFLILLGFCHSGYLHDSLHKRRKVPWSSVLLKPQLLCSWALSWPLLNDHMWCLLTWKKKKEERYEQVSSAIVYSISHQVLDMQHVKDWHWSH